MSRQLTIPEIRDRMKLLAKELMFLAEATRRRTGRRTKVRSKPITEYMKKKIRRLATKYPSASHQMIAGWCRVNQGRVSEVLRGKRGK